MFDYMMSATSCEFADIIAHPFDVRSLKNYREDIKLEVQLDEILNTKSLNLYSFDAHSHVSRDAFLETGNLVTASNVMKAEDFEIARIKEILDKVEMNIDFES